MNHWENTKKIIEHDRNIVAEQQKRIEALREQAQSVVVALDYELSELNSMLSNFDKSLSRIELYSCKTSG